MRPSIVMKKNNFIMSLLISDRFSRNARLKRINCSRYRSPVMESPGFSSLYIVNKTLLVPQIQSMLFEPWMFGHVWCWYWDRWQRLTELSVVFFLLGVVVKYPLLISNHNPMQKNFSLLSLNQLFASEKSPFSWFQFIRPISLFLNHSHGSQSYRNGLLSYPPMILQAALAFDSDLLRVMPLIFCLRIFLVRAKLIFNAEIFILETSKPFPTWFQLEQCHHKLR